MRRIWHDTYATCMVFLMAVAAHSNALHSLETHSVAPRLEFDSREDVLVVTWNGSLEAHHILSLMRRVDAHVDAVAGVGRRTAIVIDASRAAVPTPLIQAMLVDWMLESSPKRRRTNVCTYVVASSPLIRGVVSAIRWRTGRGGNLEHAADLSEAIEHASLRVAVGG